MKQKCGVTHRDAISNQLLYWNRYKGYSWREIAEFERYESLKPGTICRFATDPSYEPKDDLIRDLLGLPIRVIQYKDPITGRFIKKE